MTIPTWDHPKSECIMYREIPLDALLGGKMVAAKALRLRNVSECIVRCLSLPPFLPFIFPPFGWPTDATPLFSSDLVAHPKESRRVWNRLREVKS